MICPMSDDLVGTDAAGEARRLGFQLLEHVHDERRVAIDVRADLQHGNLAVAAGQQTEFPVLYKRGMGITLEESFNACEYVASEGNRRIVFCLRGVKSNLGDPHRNFVDVAHVPVVKRLTRLPVCVDPSHSIGRREAAPDGMLDIQHISAQAVIAGAQIPIEDRQIDDVLVGQHQGSLGIGSRQDPAVESRFLEPFAKGLSDRLLVIDDQDGIGRVINRRHGQSPRIQMASPISL